MCVPSECFLVRNHGFYLEFMERPRVIQREQDVPRMLERELAVSLSLMRGKNSENFKQNLNQKLSNEYVCILRMCLPFCSFFSAYSSFSSSFKGIKFTEPLDVLDTLNCV